jgi:5'-3' exonuclease
MIALIDGDSIAYIAGADKVDKDSYTGDRIVLEKDETIVKQQIHSIIDEILKAVNAESYILFLTGRGNFRYDVFSDYKANRKKVEPPRLMQFAKQYLQSLPGVYTTEKIEADDAVNILKNHYGENSIICSPDKDVLNLKGTHFNYRKMEFHTTDEKAAELCFWTDMISGQSGDNIKGIPGKGPAYAKNIFSTNTSWKLPELVLAAYRDSFKDEREAIKEFSKNYLLLKILDLPDYDFNINNHIPFTLAINNPEKNLKLNPEF